MLAFAKDLSIVVAGVVALVTFATGVWQYARQGRQGRVQHFVDMRRRFLEDPIFRDLLNHLANDDPELAQAPIQDRRNLVGFLEEVALMVESGVINADVAHYMFGYYVKLIASSRHFWEGLDRSSPYWLVFWRFEKSMNAREKRGPDPKAIRF